ncbi:MAG TPA: hypothetical protein ENN74_01205 [Firmicutes bacterium]|nr:hypothetical protein [Bacillota bacterium]
MKIKLDENLGARAFHLLQAAGHDVATVPGQGLSSAQDRQLIETCRKESRCLVTLDVDFANPLIFKPSDYKGIAVLRLPPKSSPNDLYGCVQTFAQALAQGDIRGRLWIVQQGRVRQYQEE